MKKIYNVSEMSGQETVNSSSETSAVTDGYSDKDDKLEELKRSVDKNWIQCDKLYIAIGRDLLAAKSLIKEQGKWLNWLKEKIPFSVRQAQRFMRVAEWFGETTPASHLDFTKAYILTRIPKPRVNDFLKKYQTTGTNAEPLSVIQTMGKRELEDAIREYLRVTPPVSPTRKEKKVEADSSATPANSALDELCHLEAVMSGLVESIVNQRIGNEEYDTVISEIRRLCEDALGKLPSEDVEIG